MERIASTLLVLFLLAATATAFVLTEGLKLTRSPIYRTQVPDKIFSPVCDCETKRARVRFTLREADRLTVAIVTPGGEVVRTLVDGSAYPAGQVRLTWNGRGDDGLVVAEGTYQPRVHLQRQQWTILMPNEIEVDTTPPAIEQASVAPPVFSPDGDGRADRIVLRYRFSEPARAALLVNGQRRVRKKFIREQDTLVWGGRVDGRPVRPGTYRLALLGRDRAGNLSPTPFQARVVVRYVALGRELVRAVAGGPLAVRVSTDAERVRWRLAGRTGTASPGTLRLRAPVEPGRYTLFVSANGRAARATVVVREP